MKTQVLLNQKKLLSRVTLILLLKVKKNELDFCVFEEK